jgi:hypothetical protein
MIAFALLCPMMSGPSARAQVATLMENSQIEPRYVRPANPRFVPIYDRLRKRRVLEELKQFLAALRLPRKLVVQFDTCGANSRPYKPGGAVTVCYELVDRIETLATQRAQSNARLREMVVTGGVIQDVLTETADAVFDVLKVPIWGREPDAADRLAALIMLQFGEDTATTAVLGTAQLFQWSNKTWTGKDFASVDSPEAQRFFNYICTAYGGDPIAFRGLVSGNFLPSQRAARCRGEYEQIRRAFNLRIMPFVDPDLLIKIRSTPGLRPGDGK